MNSVRKLRIFVELLSTINFNIIKNDQLFIVKRSIETLKELIDYGFIEDAYTLKDVTSDEQTLNQDFRTFMADNLHLLLYPILWEFNELIRLGQVYKDGTAAEEVTLESLENCTSKLIDQRNDFVDHLVQIMRMESAETTFSNLSLSSQILRWWKIEAFRSLSTIRTFFPQQFSMFAVVDHLAFQPSEEILHLQRAIFESEEEHLKQLFLKKKTEEVDPQLITIFTQELLLPLGQSLFVDFEHINRRQAAAILRYYNVTDDFADITSDESYESQKELQDTVQYFAKKLKEYNIVTFAEVQLATLKLIFHDDIHSYYTQKVNETNDAADKNEGKHNHIENDEKPHLSLKELEKLESRGLNKLVAISSKFAKLFVFGGKGKGLKVEQQSSLTAIVALLKAGVDFLFSNLQEFEVFAGFSAALIPYLRMLTQSQYEYLHSYFEGVLVEVANANEVIENLITDEQDKETAFVQNFREFRFQLEQGAAGTNGSVNTSRKIRFKIESKSKKSKAPKLETMMEDSDDDMKDDDASPPKQDKSSRKLKSKKKNQSKDSETNEGNVSVKVANDRNNTLSIIDEEDEEFVAFLRETKKIRNKQPSAGKKNAKSKGHKELVEPARRSQRASSQQKVSYYEDENSEVEVEEEEVGEIDINVSSQKSISTDKKQKSQESALSNSQLSNISVVSSEKGSSDKDKQLSNKFSGKKRSQNRILSLSPALNLDLEEGDEESPHRELNEEDEIETSHNRKKSKKALDSSDEMEVDNLDALPSRRNLIIK
jgi:hypothetical protein